MFNNEIQNRKYNNKLCINCNKLYEEHSYSFLCPPNDIDKFCFKPINEGNIIK